MNKKTDNKFFNLTGLPQVEVEKQLQERKKNLKKDKNSKSVKDIIVSNVFTLLNLLVLILFIIIMAIKRYDQLLFLLVNFLNLSLGIVQEIKAKRTLDKISLLMSNDTHVVRDSVLKSVSMNEVVVKDLLFLELGAQIVADAKIAEGTLEVNESFLTGESKTVFKSKGDFLYSGSYVVSGRACAEITAVGDEMYISKLTHEAKKYKNIKTPLMQNFANLVMVIMILLIPTTFIFYFSYESNIRTENKSEFLLGLSGFMIGMMPSGLFLLTSMSLAVGFVNLAKKNAYMKDLFGIEMLTQIDILCLDKTGTITDGTMEVKEVYSYSEAKKVSEDLMTSIISAFPDDNPTQKALHHKFLKNDYFLKGNHKIKKIEFFSSLRKYSAVEFEQEGTFLLGAPEIIFKKKFAKIEKDVEKHAKMGYRVLLLAQTSESIEQMDHNTEYQAVSLIMLEDKIKADAFDTVTYFKNLGIQMKIISGDNPSTISYIAQRIGVIESKKQAISLAGLSEKEIIKIAHKYDVFGRVTPEQKQILIKTLKQDNKKVAMIGDGVNDILAFKESDMSIAMASGSQAAQNVANLVLIDSNFSSLPQVVSEGRRVINNLEKNSVLFLVKSILSFLLAVITIFHNYYSSMDGIIFPFDPLKWNLIDIFFIGTPSFFLSLEPNDKPLNKNFLNNILKNAFFFASLIAFNYIYLLHVKWSDQTKRHDNVSVLLMLITSFMFCFLLFKNCLPFNKWKTLLFHAMIVGFLTFGHWTFFRKREFQKVLFNITDKIYNHLTVFILLAIINIIFVLGMIFIKQLTAFKQELFNK
ncbi:MAG: cation transport ATPase [Candidatus Phytoplasma pruni]|uniref:HAD-IC family P-type ATPase n=1 Tax=Poinsettia branch-inducing phytoplasma TaxID=138647 RepID=UPI00035F4B86|nr:HAD-IC family P-type ATPase [Poinsettia branch-inducing phytoplasma]WEK82334.1 MAG: cation transport ATPase [Candidatus Phytoplasma pruni]